MLGGLPVHITQRGNNRAACFFAEHDRKFYLHHLTRLLRQSQCALHAYCLMTNHVHLLVTPVGIDSCATLMKRLGQLHSQYVNRTYGRTGSLWEGRFRSCIVQSENYLLSCYRYIELNPVRAGLTAHPREYPWSSYRINAEGDVAPMVTPNEEFLRLGRDDAERRRTYRALFEAQDQERTFDAIRQATRGNYVLGDKSFRAAMGAKLGRRVERGSAGRPVQKSGDESQVPDLFNAAAKNVVCP